MLWRIEENRPRIFTDRRIINPNHRGHRGAQRNSTTIMFCFAGCVGSEWFLGGRVFDHFQEDTGFGTQGTATGMDYIEAALQWFGVEEFHGGEFTEADFASDGKLGQERQAEAAFDHAFGGL